MEPAMRAVELRRSFRFAALRGSTLLRPPTPHGLTAPQPNPGPKPGTDQRASLVGEVGARPHHSEAHLARSHPCTSTASPPASSTASTTDPATSPSTTPTGAAGGSPSSAPPPPSSSTTSPTIDTHDWQIHDTADLATHLGLGRGSGLHSPLIRTFDRLTRFGFGTFDIEPGHPDADPCITLWSTIGLVPERTTRSWPEAMQQAHAIDLAALHRAAA